MTPRPIVRLPDPTLAQQLEDAEFLLDAGEHPVRVAARVGVALPTLVMQARRAGRTDLARRLDGDPS